MSKASGKTDPPPPAALPEPAIDGAEPPVARLTLAHVAEVAGVHPTTVSLALRDHPSIPLATRSRIHAVATELGYRRDPVLDAFNFHRVRQARRAGPRLALAFVVDGTSTRFFAGKAYHPLVWEGASAVVEAHNYSLDSFTLGPRHLSPARLKTIVSTRGISGVLVSTFDIGADTLDLDWDSISAVKIESHHLAPHLDAVSSDQLQVTRLAMRRLRECGYRRIGLVTAKEDELRLTESFRMGVLVEQTTLPEVERVPPLIFSLAETCALPSLVPDWARKHHVDVIISNWNELLEVFVAAGLRVPEDIAFASLDTPPHLPHVAGVVQNHRLVGVRAMEQLCILVETNQRGVPATQSITYVPGFWRDGASVPIRSRAWYP